MIELFLSLLTSMNLNVSAAAEPGQKIPGVTATEILIGSTSALTGLNSVAGTSIRKGAEAYYNRINEAGGIHGRKIKLLSLDDGYEPKRSRDNADMLIQRDKVFALVGGNGGAGVSAMMPTLVQSQTPLMFPYASIGSLYEPVKKNVFAIAPPTQKLAEDLLKYLIEERKFKKYSMFYLQDPSSNVMKDEILKIFAKHNLKLLRTVYHERKETSFAKQAEELKKSGAEVVFLGTNTIAVIDFVNKCIEQDYHPVFAVNYGGSIARIKAGLKGKAEIITNEVVPVPTLSQEPIIKEYLTDMKGVDPVDPVTAFFAYFGARIFLKAVEAAGPELTTDKLIAALEKMNEDFGGIRVIFSKDRHYGLESGFMYRLEGDMISRLK